MVCFLHKAALACNGMVCTFFVSSSSLSSVVSPPPPLSEAPTFAYISGHNVVQVIEFCTGAPHGEMYIYICMALKGIGLVTVVRALATSTTAWKSVVLLSSSSRVGC